MTTAPTANTETTRKTGRRPADIASTSSSVSTLRRTTPQDPSRFLAYQLPPTADPNTFSRHRSLVATVGSNISLPCSSSVNITFLWRYCFLGCSETPVVYNGDKVDGGFKLALRASVRECTFHVDDIRLDDAGSFWCLLPKVDKQWSLTIFGKQG